MTRAVDDLAALCVWKERSTAGFPGAILTVRPPPVEKAWMGAQAGPDPDQDDPAFYGNEDCVDARAPLLALPAVTGGPVPAMTAGVTTVARPWSYRCLADAVRSLSLLTPHFSCTSTDGSWLGVCVCVCVCVCMCVCVRVCVCVCVSPGACCIRRRHHHPLTGHAPLRQQTRGRGRHTRQQKSAHTWTGPGSVGAPC